MMTTAPDAVAEAISCLVHYRGDAQAYDLSLRITVRPSWFARTTRAALLGPFCDAYNRKVKGGPTLDPFAARLATADGSVVGGGEGVGAVVRAVQELFVVGRDYCFHRTWRDRDLAICGRSAELALRTPAGLAVYASDRYLEPPAAANAARLPAVYGSSSIVATCSTVVAVYPLRKPILSASWPPSSLPKPLMTAPSPPTADRNLSSATTRSGTMYTFSSVLREFT